MKTRIYDLFVSSNLCKLLQQHGLGSNTPFKYHAYNDDKEFIVSPLFDYMQLYDPINVEGVHSAYTVIPAYTMADMIAIMPNWALNEVNNVYECSLIGEHADIGIAKDPRYVDAMALTLLRMLKLNLVEPTRTDFLTK